jgi:hypothetical protein
MSIKHTGGDASQGWHALMRSMSGLSAPVTIQTCVSVIGYNAGTFIAGLVMADGTTVGSGKQVSRDDQGTGATSLRHWTGYNTFGAELSGSPTQTDVRRVDGKRHMRLTWVSANTWRGESSPDGVSWLPFNLTSNQADASHTMTPTHMGIWFSSYGSGSNSGGIFTFDYFRVTT